MAQNGKGGNIISKQSCQVVDGIYPNTPPVPTFASSPPRFLPRFPAPLLKLFATFRCRLRLSRMDSGLPRSML
ncbi:hypothetical protein Ancab_000759 [Ancistrocladus abbreviatus]